MPDTGEVANPSHDATSDPSGPLPAGARIGRWVLLLAAANSALIVLGWALRDREFSGPGLLRVAGVVLVQGLLVLAATRGPARLSRVPGLARRGLLVGGLFAVGYVLVLGWQSFATTVFPFNVIWWFVGMAAVGGAWELAVSGRWTSGVLASAWTLVLGTAIWSTLWLTANLVTWGSDPWLTFWSNEGVAGSGGPLAAVGRDRYVFQDLEGAIALHPILSVVLGGVVGLLVSGVWVAGRAVRGRAGGR